MKERQPRTPRGRAPPGSQTPSRIRRTAPSPPLSALALASISPALRVSGQQPLGDHGPAGAVPLGEGSTGRLETWLAQGFDADFVASTAAVSTAAVLADHSVSAFLGGVPERSQIHDGGAVASSLVQQHDGGAEASSLLQQFASAGLEERARLQVPLLAALRTLSTHDAGQLLLAIALRGEAATPPAELHAELMFARHDAVQMQWQLDAARQHIAHLQRHVMELQGAVDRAADGMSMASSGVHGALAHERGDAVTLERADAHEREAFDLGVRLQDALARLDTTAQDLARTTDLLHGTRAAHAHDAFELQAAHERLAIAERDLARANDLRKASEDALELAAAQHEHEVHGLEIHLEEASAQQAYADQASAALLAKLVILQAEVGEMVSDMADIMSDVTSPSSTPDAFHTPPRMATADDVTSAGNTVVKPRVGSTGRGTRCSLLQADDDLLPVSTALRLMGEQVDLRKNLGVRDRQRFVGGMSATAAFSEKFGLTTGVYRNVPAVMKASVRAEVVSKLLDAASRMFPKRSMITSMSDVIHKIRDIIEQIHPPRHHLATALDEDSPEAVIQIYGVLYSSAQGDAEDEDIRAAISEDQDLLFLVVQRGLAHHSQAFKSDLETRSGVRGGVPLKELAGMKGLAALIYLREHFFPSTWQQLPDAFARMYELGTQFSDMTVNRFYGNFTEFCKILQDEVDAFEREYGAIDSALFVRLQLLQAIFTSSHDHIVAFRKLGMEKGDITSHDLNFRDASGKVTDLAAMLREHERSRPDVHVWDKTPKSECEARRLMQERTSTHKGKAQTHVASEVKSLQSQLRELQAAQTGIAEAFYGADFKRDDAAKCGKCGFPHAADGPCLTAELVKRLIDQQGVLMRMLVKTESVLSRVSQSGGNTDKLKQELDTVAKEIARTRTDVIAAVGTPKGRTPRPAATGKKQGSNVCFKWQQTGKCEFKDRGSCRFDHPPKTGGAGPKLTCEAIGCNKKAADLPNAKFCSVDCMRKTRGPHTKRVREEAHLRELDAVPEPAPGDSSYLTMMSEIHALSGSVYHVGGSHEHHEVHICVDAPALVHEEAGMELREDDVAPPGAEVHWQAGVSQMAPTLVLTEAGAAVGPLPASPASTLDNGDDIDTWWVVLQLAFGQNFVDEIRDNASLLHVLGRPSQLDEARLDCLDLSTSQLRCFFDARDAYLLQADLHDITTACDNLCGYQAVTGNGMASSKADAYFEMILQDESLARQDFALLTERKQSRRRRRYNWDKGERHDYWRTVHHCFSALRRNLRWSPLERGFHFMYVNWRARRSLQQAALQPDAFAMAQHPRLGEHSVFCRLPADLLPDILRAATHTDPVRVFDQAFDAWAPTHDMEVDTWFRGAGSDALNDPLHRIWRPTRLWRPRTARPPRSPTVRPVMVPRGLRHTGRSVPGGTRRKSSPSPPRKSRARASSAFMPQRTRPQLRRMLWIAHVRALQREARVPGQFAADPVRTYFVDGTSGPGDSARLRYKLSTYPVESRLSYFLHHHDLHADTALPAGRRLRTLLHMHRTQRLSHSALDLRYGSVDEIVGQVDDVARGLAAAGGVLFGQDTDVTAGAEGAQYEQSSAATGRADAVVPPDNANASFDLSDHETDDEPPDMIASSSDEDDEDQLSDNETADEPPGMIASSSDEAHMDESDDADEDLDDVQDDMGFWSHDGVTWQQFQGECSMHSGSARLRGDLWTETHDADADDEFDQDSDDEEFDADGTRLLSDPAAAHARQLDGLAKLRSGSVQGSSLGGAPTAQSRSGSVQGSSFGGVPHSSADDRVAQDFPSAYMHPLSSVAMTEPYRFLEFSADRQEYCNLNFDTNSMRKLLQCYKMKEHGLDNIILHLVDSGSSCFLSPDRRHFYVRRPCDTAIKGIGKENVTEYAPLFYSFVTHEGGYVMLQFDRVYHMETLDFPIFSSGKANELGFVFVLASDHPHMLTPDGRHVPLIRDSMTGFMWIAERCLAANTVRAQQYAVAHARDNLGAQSQAPIAAPDPSFIEIMPMAADDKSSIDGMIARQQGTYGGSGIAATSSVESACPAATRRALAYARGAAAAAWKPVIPPAAANPQRVAVDQRGAELSPSSSSDDSDENDSASISAARRATRALDACDLNIGDVVWVPYARRLWPAQISAPQMLRRAGFPASVLKQQKDDCILIHFFDNWETVQADPNKRMYAWAPRSRMRAFHEWADDNFASQDSRFAAALQVASALQEESRLPLPRRVADVPAFDPDLRVPASPTSVPASSPGASMKDNTKSIAASDEAEAMMKRLRSMSDDEYMQWIRQHAVKRPKPVRVRLPAMRLVDTGEPTEVQKLKSYVHRLFGHLSDTLIWEMIDHVEGSELIKAVLLTRQGHKAVPGPHCDHCAEYKERLPPRPAARTTRPTRMTRIAKMYFDQSGHIAEPSAFHGFHYYNLGLANDGFMYIEGLVHLSQTLFAMAKTYDDAGGAPVVTQIDGGGAMNSKTADKFYAARNTKKVVTVHHWQHGKCERKHMIKSMARAMMSAAGAPTSFWYLAVRHAVLISNVILPARDEHGKTIGGTVWEAHYGVKPRVQDLLLGPWGCLAYLIMTEEQRQKQHKKRGETKHWGVRAISGIYVGSYCDPQTLVFKHLMTDGRSIYASAGQIKVVGDVYPLRLQVARDLALRWGSEDREAGDDDHQEVAFTLSEHWAERAHLQEDHMHDKLNRGHRQLDRWHSAAHTKAYDDDFDCYAFAAAVTEAKQEHQAQLEREFAFVASTDPEMAAIMRERNTTKDSNPVAKRPLRVLADKILGREEGHVPLENLFEPGDKTESTLEPEDPFDFEIQAAPPDFVLEKPYDSCRYELAVPSDFVSGKSVPLDVVHPHVLKYTGRAVRKSFKKKGRGGTLVSHDITGKVSSYKEKQGHFEVRFSDGQLEAMDLEQLHEILIMGKKFGDDKTSWGRTRAEMEKQEYAHLLAEAIDEVMLHAKMPDNLFYDGMDAAYQAPASASGLLTGGRSGLRVRWAGRLCRVEMPSDTPPTTSLSQARSRPGWDHSRTLKHCTDICHFDDVRDADGMWERVSRAIHHRTIRKAVPHLRATLPAGETQLQSGGEWQRQQTALQRQAPRTVGGEQSFAADKSEVRPVKTGERGQPPDGIDDWEIPIYDDEPKNAKEKDAHPERELLDAAAEKEVQQFKDMGVGVIPSEEEIADVIRRGHKILRAKMVYKRKYEIVVGKDGQARERFLKWKARLAVVGTGEVEGVDTVWNTFSPTIGFTAVRLLISLMCNPDFDVRSYDLSGAFLGTELKDRSVYVKLPKDAGSSSNQIIRLVKSAYGLKASSKEFVKQLSDKIMDFRSKDGGQFRRLSTDHCIYVYEGKHGEKIYLAHYVDDIICGANDSKLREEFFNHLREKWAITDEGTLDRFVGVHFTRSEDKRSWSATIGGYIDKIAKRFGMEQCRFADTPMDPGFVITERDLEEEPTEEMKSTYRSLIGSIGFCATAVRYDIAYAVSVLSRHLARPNTKLIAAAKRVIQYLKRTRNFGITWSCDEATVKAREANVLFASVDASYANCQLTRKSHGGWLTFVNNGCVSWKSGRQPIVTLSSCEAEYVALCSMVCEVKYLRSLMAELGFPQEEPTLIWEDNRATIMIAENDSSSAGRCKHIDVRFRFVAEAVRDGAVRVRYCPSAYNYADILTKPLVPVKFDSMRHMCHDSKVDQMSARGVSDEAWRTGERDSLSEGSFLIYF